MAKNNTKLQSAKKTATIQGKTPAEKKKSNRLYILLAIGIAAVTWLVFSAALGNQFTNWDDPPYIKDNTLIKDISWAGIKRIFSTPVAGNYHPLTILTYALEYSIVQLEPWLYHFDNLVLHVITTMLVYWLGLLLLRNTVAAAIISLLFGIHPMHVESVVWLSARKDVLYGVFYIAACIAYLFFRRTADVKRWWWYALTSAFYLLALLSKPVAVLLPVSLLLIDYFEARPLLKQAWLEKAPFFLLSLIFGLLAVKVQVGAGAMAMLPVHFNLPERIALSCYAFCTYLWKAVVPVGLCCFYPYPPKVNDALPIVYYLYPLAALAVCFLAWRVARKNRLVVFGCLFFLANIVLLLQFLQVGAAVMADRYTYIPYLGLFFIAGSEGAKYLDKAAKNTRNVIAAISLLYLGVLASLSVLRSYDWYDAMTLWQADIKHEPVPAPQAYNNLGFIYYSKWAASNTQSDKAAYYDSASYLLHRAISIRPDFMNPYISLGEMERGAGQYAQAKADYLAALKMKPAEPNIYLGLAILYMVEKNYDSSEYCFRTALLYNPAAEAHGNLANFLEIRGKNDSAMIEYNKAISMNPDMHSLYLNRGKLFEKIGRLDDALNDYNKGLKLNPDDAQLHYQRSLCYKHKGDNARALSDVEKAIALGYNRVDEKYYEALRQSSH